MISAGISSLFLASVMSAWYFSGRTFQDERARYQMRYESGKVLERIKDDVRLSDGNNILFYPASGTEFTAISIPGATANNAGFLTLTNSGITWDHTIIYHLADDGNGGTELRRVRIPSYAASNSTRQAQLDSIVGGGVVAGSTVTTLIRSDDVTLRFTPTSPTFDGYSATPTTSGAVSFGSVRLSAGDHQIRFQVTGRNDASSGYEMGIDTVSLTPSGGIQEAEVLTVTADTGDPSTIEDMSGVGFWSGNHHREYRSNTIGDYVEFETYYDQWLESNFYSMTHSNTVVDGNDPVLTILSREDQSATPAWQSTGQASTSVALNQPATGETWRTVISSGSIVRSGQMVRFKIRAGSASLVIQEAYIGLRSGLTEDLAGAPTQLFFDNAPQSDGAVDPVGALAPGVATAVTIPAGQYVWTNWMETGFGSGVDYLFSCYVSSGDAAIWQDTTPGAVHSYRVAGNSAATLDITPLSTSDAVFAVEEIATFQASGAAISQIYDTKLDAPSYGTISWSSTLPPAAQIRLYVRTSDDRNMVGATDWSMVAPITTSPANLSGAGSERYIQFRAELDAGSPYLTLPTLDDVRITWPGQTALVEVSGQFTKKPDYGTFTVKVDGQDLVNALSVDIELSQDVQGREHTHAVSAEMRPRNTGK